MGFGDAIRAVLSKYATFSGRALRSEYWWWTLFLILLQIATSVVDAVIFGVDEGSVQLLTLLVSLALFLPGLAVTVRRLHDTGYSGWWVLIVFIPLIGWIVLLYWMIKKGDEGTNQYGGPASARVP
ncbi:DUF805 domain-containing protein [Flaviflagellibacter deserti]|uniref:DUF805 domain-containing protein n=1 Tax=Flaviflagellibacter deserti TaxID=2267266 RepID=A0ABV9YXS3_9HYPH